MSVIYFLFLVSISSTLGRVAKFENNILEPGIKKNTKILDIAIATNVSREIQNIHEKEILTNEIEANSKEDSVNDVNLNENVNKSLVNSTIEKVTKKQVAEDENVTVLTLTEYIKEGRIDEARNVAKVNSSLFQGIDSYSGHLTVNETYNSNLFFWYLPAKNNIGDTPWIIWLQGGPGASSLLGAFVEIGPFYVDNKGNLKANPYTWLQNHSLVFIDNPVGAGFSFTNHEDGFASDMETYSQHLHDAVQQLLSLFPELRTAPLYVAGESYAGKYVPALAWQLHQHKNTELAVNLKGLMIGNAFVGPDMLINLTTAFYHFSLLDKEEVEIMQPLQQAFSRDVASNKSEEARKKWNNLITIVLTAANQQHAYNFLQEQLEIEKYSIFLNRSDIRNALHVGNIKYDIINHTVHRHMGDDFLSSAKDKIEEILEHYRILAYCGNLDQILPCVSLEKSHRTWNWSGSQQFAKASRRPFLVNNKLAGYFKSGGQLTEVVVLGAGHMVPFDTPAQSQYLITRWINNLDSPFELLTENDPTPIIDINDNEIVKDDSGTALILTPYIKGGQIKEGRSASEVDATVFLGVRSHSGYLTVDEKYNSNMFFWYFPVENKPINETPWIIWLQEGSGISSLLGLFDEIGPFKVNGGGVLEKNAFTWLQNHTLVFIDSPVGAGFSYTEHDDGYASDMNTYAQQLDNAVQQLVTLFPELRTAPLYVAGESYAGKYVPSLAWQLHQHKNTDLAVNLTGLIMGNAVIDPLMLNNIVENAYYYGLIGPEQLDELQPSVEKLTMDIAANRSLAAADSRRELNTLLMRNIHLPNPHNIYLDHIPYGKFVSFLQKPEVKRAIHVGDKTFILDNKVVEEHLEPDFLSSSKSLIEKLLENYKVLAYCGHLDLVLPCIASSEVHNSLNWTGSQQFRDSSKQHIIFNKHSAGFLKTGGGLTEVMFRGAGQMVPMDVPEHARYLVTSWTHNTTVSIPKFSKWVLGEIVKQLIELRASNSTSLFDKLYYL